MFKKILMIPCFFLCVTEKANTESPFIPDSMTKEFLTCAESPEMSGFIDNLVKDKRKAAQISDSYFEFKVRGSVLSLPFKGIWVGVCDMSGERSCGWASMRAYILDTSYSEAQRILKDKYQTDFTIEKRENEAEVTDRPALSYLKTKKLTVLFCDPGSL